MSEYSVYRKQTGQILWNIDSPDDQSALEDALIGVIAGTHNGDVVFVVDGAAVPRPTMDIEANTLFISADDVEEAVVTGLPPGTVADIAGVGRVAVDDGELVFTTDEVGLHKITFSVFPFIPAEVTISAS